jgi:O-antigen ligase
VHAAGEVCRALVAAGALAGAVYALADRRVAVGPRATRVAGRLAALALVTVVVAAAAVFVVRVPEPRDFFAAQWHAFKHLPSSKDTSSTHLVSLGSNRYDFWRVALDTFANHPLAGIGSRGFRAAYLLHRRSPETPARSHSVELDALSETGIVGFLLLAAALVAAAAAVGRRARSDLVSAAALGAFACWLAHASVDWTWSFPAIGVPVFVLVGTGAAGGGARLPGRVAAVLAAAAAALAIGAFGLPWLSARYVRAALDGSTHARADLQHARTLDPLSLDPLLAAWALAPTPEAGLPPLVTAARREPRSPDMLYLLGRQQVFAGRARAGVRTLERALRLDPGDPTILAALRRGRRAHRAATPRRATSSAAP